MKTECWCAHPTERWAASRGPACARRAWKGVAAWSERPRQADERRREPGTEESFFCFLCCGERYELDALPVLLDACHYARGKFEGCAAGGAIDARLRARAYRFYKGFQLRMQRLNRWRRELFVPELGLRSRLFRDDTQSVATRVIERNVLVLLKKAHLAHALGGNAACGYIRHRASREFQARVGDIHFVREHRNSDRLYLRNRLFHEREQDVQIVNHQVVNYVHVEAARREHSQPVHLEEKRIIQDGLDGQHRGVESLYMADLQHTLMTLGRGQERIRFGKAFCHGLFDNNVEAHLHQAATNCGVLGGGYGDTYGIGSTSQLIERSECVRTEFGGSSLR